MKCLSRLPNESRADHRTFLSLIGAAVTVAVLMIAGIGFMVWTSL